MPVPDVKTQQYHGLLQAVVGRPCADNWYRLGAWLHDEKHWGAAACCFARVVEEQPGNYRAAANLGWNLHLGCRAREGLEWLDWAVELKPDEGQALALRAQVRMILGDDTGAVEDGLRAVECEPGVPLSHLSAAFGLLNAGDYRRGWLENEWRFQYTIPEFLTRPYRLWRGEWVESLYIEQEQGVGDSLMALRWVPEAASRVGRVTLYVGKELYGLVLEMGHLPENVTVYPLPRPLPMADAFSPMMSLPAAMEIDSAEAVGAYLT